jgi:hypothetical protein
MEFCLALIEIHDNFIMGFDVFLQSFVWTSKLSIWGGVCVDTHTIILSCYVMSLFRPGNDFLSINSKNSDPDESSFTHLRLFAYSRVSLIDCCHENN